MIVRGSKCEVPQPFASSPIISINRVNIYNIICYNMFNIVMIRNTHYNVEGIAFFSARRTSCQYFNKPLKRCHHLAG